jgi:hypothetical protein
VIAASRAKGVIVTSTWIAALTLALAEAQGNASPTGKLEPKAGLATFATYDMRRFFPSEFDAWLAAGHVTTPLYQQFCQPTGRLRD